MKKLIKFGLYTAGVALLLILVFILTLWINSPGKTEPIRDSSGKIIPGSIATMEELILGEQKQFITIRGVDSTLPVMLFLHGGPGGPNLQFRSDNPEIEKDFVMVYWEQLGAGKSYSAEIPDEKMTVSQFIMYTKKLSEYLAKRFKKEKIFLMGESWGTLLAILAIQQNPELYHAYFGTGQMVHTYKGEQISLAWVKEKALQRNDEKGISELSQLNLPDSLSDGKTWTSYFDVHRKYLFQYGGVAIDILDNFKMFKIMFFAKEYTLDEKIQFNDGYTFSLQHLSPIVTKVNFLKDIDSLEIPVYFLQGRHDYATPYVLVEQFYTKIKAPKKELISFENSAHGPHIEESARFNEIVREKARL